MREISTCFSPFRDSLYDALDRGDSGAIANWLEVPGQCVMNSGLVVSTSESHQYTYIGTRLKYQCRLEKLYGVANLQLT